VLFSRRTKKRSDIILFERKRFNPFATMGPTGGTHYILARNLIDKHFLFLFSGRRLYVMCYLLCLRYFLNPLLHCMILLVKTIKTKKSVTVRLEVSFLSYGSLFLIVVLCFSHSHQHNVFGQCAQILSFLRAFDRQLSG
jgi:hypothetical protein